MFSLLSLLLIGCDDTTEVGSAPTVSIVQREIECERDGHPTVFSFPQAATTMWSVDVCSLQDCRRQLDSQALSYPYLDDSDTLEVADIELTVQCGDDDGGPLVIVLRYLDIG